MAEAIGLAASLGGLISLGLSVCDGLVSYYSSYKSAETDIQLLCEEVNNLTQILQSFGDAMKDSEMRVQLESSALRSIEACNARVAELDDELKKVIGSDTTHRRPARGFLSKTARSLYPFKEGTLRKLRNDVSRTNEMLQQAASSVLIRQNNKMLDTVDRFYEKAESKEIMRWLGPPNPSQSHAVASSRRGSDTGSWFIGSPKFRHWKADPCSVLWVYGSAGCGKTVLCSTIINHLIDACKDSITAGIAYFYFDYTNASILQHHDKVLRSLIEQLSAQNGSIPRPLKSLYERCRNGTTQPTEAELAQTLRNIIKIFSPCYLIIDAVDESKQKQDLLKFLNIVAGEWCLPQIHFLLTSRTELGTEIPTRSWPSVSVSIENGVDADVRMHIRTTLEDPNGVLSQWDTRQRNAIAESLISASHENFRWVACQLQALSECHTVEELEEALGSLPASLEETYERSLLSVEEKRKEGFRHVLLWLSFSIRPMQLDEVAEILAINVDAKPRPQYDPRRRFVNTARFFHKHSNLVSVLTSEAKGKQYQELRLAHLSVRDYLISNRIICSPASYFNVTRLSAHKSIAEACIIYLQQFAGPDALDEEQPDAHALARYAARFWSYHVRAATAAAKERSSSGALMASSGPRTTPLILLILELLTEVLRLFGFSLPVSRGDSTEKDLSGDLNQLCVELLCAPLHNQIRYFDPDTPWIDKPDIARSIKAPASGLYYAAQAGLTESVRELLAQGVDVNAVDGRYGTALQAASCTGYRDIIEILLENGADINQLEGDYGNALQGASCYGHEECVKVLLDRGADVNAIGGEHYTALHAAAFNGHETVVGILIERGAAIDMRDLSLGRTPLIEAAAEGHTSTVQLLLKLGADSLIQDDGGWTALDESAPAGFDSVVRALIEHNPTILESRDARGESALDHTAGQHKLSTVTVLLEMGIDVNSISEKGRSALFRATKSGDKAIAQLLIEYGADVCMKDSLGWTALHVAALVGEAGVGEVLLEAGAEIDYGPDRWTALHVAILRKHVEFVEMLLEHGADIHVRALDRMTVLDCFDLHQVYGAEPLAWRLGIEDDFLTTTGLRLAAAGGHDVRIRELLERGADINARDEGGLTALMWAAMKGNTSVVRLLVENGADVNARDDEGGTVMSYLSGMDEGITKLLHEHGYKRNQLQEDTGVEEAAQDPEALNEIRQLLLSKMAAGEA